jgi:hypothetical protein
VANGWPRNRRESLIKLFVDTSGRQVTVSRETVEKIEQNGRQKQERGTGRLMWSTQVFVLDDDGGKVITVTTAGTLRVRGYWRFHLELQSASSRHRMAGCGSSPRLRVAPGR